MIENVLAQDDSDVIKYYDDGSTEYPCEPHNPREFLETYYKIENLREDYLDKQIKTNCAQQMFGQSNEENTKPVLYNHNAWTINNQGRTYCSGNDSGSKKTYDQISGHTTTLFAQRPSLILPQDKDGNYKMFNPTAKNEYLQILMPFKDVNILNSPGVDASTSDKDNLMVEIGCKIFEVNHVYSDSSLKSLNMSTEHLM